MTAAGQPRSEFIFMLTKDDQTVPDARAVYDEIRTSAIRYVGFKDIGLPPGELRALVKEMHADGREAMLEVVSERAADERRSIETGLSIGADWILGGSNPDTALEILQGSSVRYCPFPGQVIGHPSRLRGAINEIAEDARDLTSRAGVHGLDLLAYRYDGNVADLVRAVVDAATGPVIAAGSVDSLDRIATLRRLGVWAFTIGGAIFEGRFEGAPAVRTQIESVLRAAG